MDDKLLLDVEDLEYQETARLAWPSMQLKKKDLTNKPFNKNIRLDSQMLDENIEINEKYSLQQDLLKQAPFSSIVSPSKIKKKVRIMEDQSLSKSRSNSKLQAYPSSPKTPHLLKESSKRRNNMYWILNNAREEKWSSTLLSKVSLNADADKASSIDNESIQKAKQIDLNLERGNSINNLELADPSSSKIDLSMQKDIRGNPRNTSLEMLPVKSSRKIDSEKTITPKISAKIRQPFMTSMKISELEPDRIHVDENRKDMIKEEYLAEEIANHKTQNADMVSPAQFLQSDVTGTRNLGTKSVGFEGLLQPKLTLNKHQSHPVELINTNLLTQVDEEHEEESHNPQTSSKCRRLCQCIWRYTCRKVWKFIQKSAIWTKNKAVEKYRVIFFLKLRRFFGKNYLKEWKKLNPVSESDRLLLQVKRYKDLKYTENKKRSEQGKPEVSIIYLLFWIAWADQKWATLFKVCRQIISVVTPFVMKDFLDTIKKQGEVGFNYSLTICTIIGVMTLVKELFGQQAARYTSQGRKRLNLLMRSLVYRKITVANYEFIQKINAGFLSKVVLFDIDPVVEFLCAIQAIVAAPIASVVAFVLIWNQLNVSSYFMIIVSFYFITVGLLILFLRYSIIARKRFRTLTNMLHSYLSEYVQNIEYIKSNSLQYILLRELWALRIKQVKYIKKIIRYDTLVDVLCFSPTLATSTLVILVYVLLYGRIDVVTLYTFISVLGSLRSPIVSLEEGIERYQEYKKSYKNFVILFREVPDYPKKRVKKIPIKGVNFEERCVVYQYPSHLDERLIPLSFNDDFAVWFDGCTFLDRSKIMEFKVNEIMRERSIDDEIQLKPRYHNELILRKTNVKVAKKQKICLMGSEDSGVEHFLLALKKELEIIEGEMSINGRVCLYDKKKNNLITDISFRDNIILDNHYDRDKFKEICGLLGISFSKYDGKEFGLVKSNLELMTRYDKTMITLARSFYQDSDIFCFFNFFNLLNYNDKLPFYEAIVERALMFTTVFYYSNDPILASRADLVLFFKNGNIVEQGKFSDLHNLEMSHGEKDPTELSMFLAEKMKISRLHVVIHELKYIKDKKKVMRRKKIYDLDDESKAHLLAYQDSMVKGHFYKLTIALMFIKKRLRRKASNKEAHSKVGVDPLVNESRVTTKNIIKAMYKIFSINKRMTLFLSFFLIFISSLLLVFWDIWVGWWSKNVLEFSDTMIYLYVTIGLTIWITIYIYVRGMIIGYKLLNVSQKLFIRTLRLLLRADSKWLYHFTPGTVIYRLTSDQAIIDVDMHRNFLDNFTKMITGICGIIILNIVYPGLFLIVTLILVGYLSYTIYRYIRTVRLFMCEWYRRKPLWYRTYTLTLENLMSLRHISKHRYFESYFIFMSEEFARINSHAGTAGNRWLGVRMSLTLAGIAFMTYLCPALSVYFKVWDYKKHLWLLGFGLTWSQKAMNYLSEGITRLNLILNNEEGAERIIDMHTYAEEHRPKNLIDDEEIGDEKEFDQQLIERVIQNPLSIPIDSNKKGAIEIKNMSYTHNQKAILSNINMNIHSAAKVALVQMSGQAIETLFQILLRFRFFDEVAPQDESKCAFTIEGRDYYKWNSMILRKRFQFLKKDPFIFSGTLRDNVDPFRYHTDEKIVQVLHYLGFYEAFSKHLNLHRHGDVTSAISESQLTDKFLDRDFKRRTLRTLSNMVYYQELDEASQRKPIKQSCYRWRCCIKKKKQRVPEKLFTAEYHQFTNSTVRSTSNPRLRKLVFICQFSILLSRLLKEVRRRESVNKEEKNILKGLLEDFPITSRMVDSVKKTARKVFRAKNGQVKDDLHVESLKKAEDLKQKFRKAVRFASIVEAFKNNGENRSKIDVISQHVIPNLNEKTTLIKLLNIWVFGDSSSWSLPMKKIVAIARVILRQPDILLVDEDALIIDHDWSMSHMRGVMAALDSTTVLCKMSCYKLFKHFEVCTIFNHNTVVETGRIRDMLHCSEKQLIERLQMISEGGENSTFRQQFIDKFPSP